MICHRHFIQKITLIYGCVWYYTHFQKGSLHFCFPSIHQIQHTHIHSVAATAIVATALSSSLIFFVWFILPWALKHRILVSIYSQMCVAVKHIKLNGLRISNSLNDCCLQNALFLFLCLSVIVSLSECVCINAERFGTKNSHTEHSIRKTVCRNNNFL